MSKTELFVRKTAGGVFKVVNEAVTTGSIFWVDSGAATAADAGSNGKNPDKPFATLDYAIGKCSDNNGDIIYVMPGHAESFAAASCLTLDKAGVKIIGLGCGYSMPKFTYTTADSTIDITAANCHMENLWLYSSFTNGVTAGVTVGEFGDGLVLKDIVMEESLVTTEFLIGISIAAGAHHVTIDGLRFYGITGGSSTNAIIFVGASNFSVVKNCEIYGFFNSTAAVDATTAASTYMTFHNNIVHNTDTVGGLLISAKTETTGIMSYNSGYSAKNDVTFVGAAMVMFENYCTNAVGAHQGRLLPAADT